MRMEREPLSAFMLLTASAASWLTSWVFAHARGSRQGGREDDLRHARERLRARLAFGCESRHHAVGVRAHQDCVIGFRLLAQPREVLRTFQSPPARPALSGSVAIECRDEVDEQLRHRGVNVPSRDAPQTSTTRSVVRTPSRRETLECGPGDVLGRFRRERRDAAAVDLAEHVRVGAVVCGWTEKEVGVPDHGESCSGQIEQLSEARHPLGLQLSPEPGELGGIRRGTSSSVTAGP